MSVQGVLRDLSKNLPIAGAGQQPHMLHQQQVSTSGAMQAVVVCISHNWVLSSSLGCLFSC